MITMEEMRLQREQTHIQAPVHAAKAQKHPETQTIWLVAAWNVQGYWKIHRDSNQDEYKTMEAAEEASAKLGPVSTGLRQAREN